MQKLFRFILLGVLAAALAACGAPVHKINFSEKYNRAEVKNIAVIAFQSPTKKMDGGLVADKFTADLVGSKFFSVVDRSSIKAVMDEVKFQLSGITDERTTQKLEQLGADSILTGQLYSYEEERRKGDRFVLASEAHLVAKLIRVGTGEVLWTAEIMKRDRAKNVGKKGLITGESEADTAAELLDDIIEEMAGTLKSESISEKIGNTYTNLRTKEEDKKK